MNQESLIVEKICANKECLEIAPGKGRFLQIDPKRRIGIEVNSELAIDLQGRGLKCVCADFFRYQSSRSYEVVYARNIIEHLSPSELVSFLDKCKKIAEAKGKIVLITPVETVIWRTASHVRPYPPISLLKLLSSATERYLINDNDLSGLRFVSSYCTFKTGRQRVPALLAFILFNILNSGKAISKAPPFASHYITILELIT